MTTPTEAERDAEVREALVTADKYGYGVDSGEPFSALRMLADECRRLQSELERANAKCATMAGLIGHLDYCAVCAEESKGSCEIRNEFDAAIDEARKS